MQTIMIRLTGMVFATLLLVPTLVAQQSQSATDKADQILALQSLMSEEDSEAYARLNQIIEIDLQNVTLEEALNAIAKQADLKLMYREALLPQDKQVSYDNRLMSVYDALREVLDGTGIKFKITQNRQLVLLHLKEIEKVSDDEVQETVSGRVIDAETGEPIPGVSILVEGTTSGTATDPDGSFELNVPSLDETLVFSFVGYESQNVELDGRNELEIALVSAILAGDELVVVGYGVQRRGDVTGSVSSVSRDRLEMAPNQNISQAIQGSVPGVVIQTVSTGANPDEAILVRGRNSIAADNNPLIVVDGIPYGGRLSDINPNDVESIEILKDASAAAIYGSRGSNGVILITTSEGAEGGPRFSYEGKFSRQSFINFPDVMNGEQFYEFKTTRDPNTITTSEQEVFDAGEYVYWPDLGLRSGYQNEQNLSISGGTESISYFVSGNFMDVQGLTLGDDFQRLMGRFNLNLEVTDWLSFGTRSTVSESDRSGVPAEIIYTGGSAGGLLTMNPLSRAFNEDGTLNLTPWPDEPEPNPLSPVYLFDNTDRSNQVISNNYVIIDFPFIEGLSNRLNTGIRRTFSDFKIFRPRTYRPGYQGSATVRQDELRSTTIENILSFTRDFGQHSLFLTGVFSIEDNLFTRDQVDASIFPNDLLSWNAMGQAGVVEPSFENDKTKLLSQMLRINYSYDSRYLLTLTTRRDGFSGFGSETKWGVFPSISIAWNFANEEFFPWAETFGELKPRVSFGLSGNQAVDPYRTIARFEEENWVSDGSTQAGFKPSSLANPDLGWESSQTLNFGLDISMFSERIVTSIDYYNTTTEDLLLERGISSIHGITSVLQNIGETKNQGIDFSIQTRNLVRSDFMWSTSGNLSYNKNEILDLYGDGRDDILNNWFIGQPIRVNFDYVFDGVWQLDEADEAAEWGVEPGSARIKDVTGDGEIGPDDRQIIGQIDPNLIWGLTNSFRYKDFSLNIFITGSHGSTRVNPFIQDYSFDRIARNVVNHNFWTPDNPTNDMWANRFDGMTFAGLDVGRDMWVYEDADFIRIRDVTLSYSLPFDVIDRFGINRMRIYASVRNLHTFTNYNGLDPELELQSQAPMQREFTLGLNLDF